MLKVKLDDLFFEYRIEPSYPTYPPYHKGYYLEDYFYYNYKLDNERIYIPVFWTTCYIQNTTNGLQRLLDTLDRSKKYYTVSQHDDAIKEILPPDTLHFNAGGNKISAANVPIPLVCSKLNTKIESRERDTLACFVGSNTHPVRKTITDLYGMNERFIISNQAWSPKVVDERLHHFVDIASRSKFMLCPRGYGLNSFRLYEAFQLGCVPVVVTDMFYLPWTDEIDWSDLAVLVDVADIDKIEIILDSITDTKYKQMRVNAEKIYAEYFSLDGVCKNILKRIA